MLDLETALQWARHDASVNNSPMFVFADRHIMDVSDDTPPPWSDPEYLLSRDEYIVYPTGAAVLIADVNWFWEFEDEVRLGTARQAMRYAKKRSIDPKSVRPVMHDRIHGTCVRYDLEDTTRRCPYYLVQPRSFPAWAGY